jgi:hypothetical protein
VRTIVALRSEPRRTVPPTPVCDAEPVGNWS